MSPQGLPGASERVDYQPPKLTLPKQLYPLAGPLDADGLNVESRLKDR